MRTTKSGGTREKSEKMRKVVLFIAMSLDGYLADRDGGVGWLKGQEENAAYDDPYPAFLAGVDTVVMGWNTYRQVAEELSPEEWPYSGLESYVITHRKTVSSRERIVFTEEDPCVLVRRLAAQEGKNIWICGGASILHPLIEENLIDEYDISVIPTLLGGGIRLFGSLERELELRLTTVRSGNGIAELIYSRRR